MALMLEYWLASKFGQLWLKVQKSLQPTLGDLPAECALLAGGQRLTARRLYRAQAFAARVWWRAGMLAALLIFPVIGVSAALRPGRVGTDVGVALICGLRCLAGIAMLEMGLLSFRSGQIKLYLTKANPQAAEEPLPAGSLGRPTQWDFWILAIIAVAVFGILLFAGTRSGHGA